MYIFACLIAIIPFTMAFYYFYTLLKSLKQCKVKVEAEIINISVRESTDSEGNRTIYSNPTFRYYYDGTEYTASEKGEYAGQMYQKGDIITLYINPEAPYEILDKKRRIKAYLRAGILCLLFGILMIAVILFFACHQSS